MSTLADLKAAHPAIAQTEDYLNRGVPLSTIEQGIAALIAKAHEDEATIKEQKAQIIGESNWATQVMLERDQRVLDCQSLQRQLTASETAHAATRKALGDADKALILCRSSWNRPYDDIKHIQASTDAALAHAAARRSEKERG